MGSGPAPDGDGMVMLDFARAAVLRFEDNTFTYMPQLSKGYNEYMGSTQVGENTPPMEMMMHLYGELNA